MLTFLGLLAVVWWNFEQAGRMTFSIPELTIGLIKHPMPVPLQLLVFSALFIGFAIKVPLFPLHTWLPWPTWKPPRREACCWPACC